MAQLDLPRLTVNVGGGQITFPTLSTRFIEPNLVKCPLGDPENDGRRNGCNDIILGPGKYDQIFRSGGVLDKVVEFMSLANVELGRMNFDEVETEAKLVKQYVMTIYSGAKEFAGKINRMKQAGVLQQKRKCCYSDARLSEYLADYRNLYKKMEESFEPFYKWEAGIKNLRANALETAEFDRLYSESQIVLAQAQQEMQKSSEQTFNIRLRRFLIAAGVILAAFLIYKFVFKKK